MLTRSELSSKDWSKIYLILESQSDEEETKAAVGVLFTYYLQNTAALIENPFALNMLLDIFYRNPYVFKSADNKALFIKNTSPILLLEDKVEGSSDMGCAIDLFQQFLE